MRQRRAKDRVFTGVPGLLLLTRRGCGMGQVYSRFPDGADRAKEGMSIHVYD
jgi:L-asparaginase II